MIVCACTNVSIVWNRDIFFFTEQRVSFMRSITYIQVIEIRQGSWRIKVELGGKGSGCHCISTGVDMGEAMLWIL
jgi:hypothetical protein